MYVLTLNYCEIDITYLLSGKCFVKSFQLSRNNIVSDPVVISPEIPKYKLYHSKHNVGTDTTERNILHITPRVMHIRSFCFCAYKLKKLRNRSQPQNRLEKTTGSISYVTQNTHTMDKIFCFNPLKIVIEYRG